MRTFATLLILLTAAASAQTPGSCEIGQATGTLDASDVLASFPLTGGLFYGPGIVAEYDVPQATHASAVYAASVWIGGTVDGDLRVAGSTYGQGGANDEHFEFWPGPLDDGATLPTPADCSAYDRIWVVSAQDVAVYDITGTATDDLRDWPVGLGAPAVDAGGQPIAGADRTRVLDLAGGERPVVYGTQTAFWVMNDVGNEHKSTGSAPLGIEVAVTAFVTASETLALHQSSVFRYAVTNRNSADIEDARMAVWADTDLGSAGDDFIGADTARSMGYTYNADDNDEGGYGAHPPALGIDILGGDAVRAPQMTAFIYATGGEVDRSDPVNVQQYHRVMQGIWPDGTPLTANGTGYNQGGEATTFSFSGDPVAGAFWSEENTGDRRSTPGDRRVVLASELGRLASGETATIDVAFVYALGADRLDSVTQLRAASDQIQQRYDAGALFAPATFPVGTPPSAPSLAGPEGGASFADEDVPLSWSPVDGATDYLYQVSESPAFDQASTFNTLGTSGTYRRTAQDFVALDVTVYWRVRARRGALLGPWSEAQTFRFGREAAIPDAYIAEVVGPGGADPCGPEAVSTFGCPPPGSPLIPSAPGNLVYSSFNGTGAYTMDNLGPGGSLFNTLGSFAPNDYEIRVVPESEGSYAYYSFTTGRLIRVPFQIWDLGVATPGQPNDPADDVRMVPTLFADSGTEATDECEFGFFGPQPFDGASGTGNATQRIYAYYPVGDDYAAFEALAASAVAADPDACPGQPATDPASARIDFDRGRPIQREVFVQAGATTSMADLEGAVIRFYTREGSTPAEPEPEDTSGLALATPVPNPSASGTTLRYQLGETAEVALSVVDLLGRRVAALPQGTRSAGEHTATLDVSRLAAGVYVVLLEAGGTRRTRLLTVVR